MSYKLYKLSWALRIWPKPKIIYFYKYLIMLATESSPYFGVWLCFGGCYCSCYLLFGAEWIVAAVEFEASRLHLAFYLFSFFFLSLLRFVLLAFWPHLCFPLSQVTCPISSDKSRRRSTTKGYPAEGAVPAGRCHQQHVGACNVCFTLS